MERVWLVILKKIDSTYNKIHAFMLEYKRD